MLIRSDVVIVTIYDHEPDYANLIEKLRTKYEVIPIEKGSIILFHKLAYQEFEKEFLEVNSEFEDYTIDKSLFLKEEDYQLVVHDLSRDYGYTELSDRIVFSIPSIKMKEVRLFVKQFTICHNCNSELKIDYFKSEFADDPRFCCKQCVFEFDRGNWSF